ncbi:hypothetical protein ACIBP6_45620 [Nonomuraea terrae]
MEPSEIADLVKAIHDERFLVPAGPSHAGRPRGQAEDLPGYQ